MRTVETESFSRAGKAESVAQSTVSKEVAALEAHLGTLLIRRSSRGLSCDRQGPGILRLRRRHAQRSGNGGGAHTLGEMSARGRLRVTCSPVFSNRLIAPRLPALFAAYPDLTIDLEVSERYVSLIEDGVDVAIRIGELPDSGLLARQIGSVEAAVVASLPTSRSMARRLTSMTLPVIAALPFTFQGNSKTWKFRSPRGSGDHTPLRPAPHQRPRKRPCGSAGRDGSRPRGRAGCLPAISRPRAGWCRSWRTIGRGFIQYRPSVQRPAHDGAIKVFVDFVAGLLKDEPHLRLR